MSHGYKKFPLVYVVWRDSHTNHGWCDLTSDVDFNAKPIVSIGFLVADLETTITIAQSIGGFVNLVGDPMTVPKENIVEWGDLELPDLDSACIEGGK